MCSQISFCIAFSDCLGRRLGPKLLGRSNDSGVNFFIYSFINFLYS